MEIKYFGNGKIYLKGKKESLWFNPTKEELGSEKMGSRIVIFTESSKNFVHLGEEGDRVIIAGPGEYEVGGVEINGVNSMYAINMDGIKIVMVGKLEGEINEKKKEKLEEADVLLVELSKNAVDIAKKSAANYVIPLEYSGEEKEEKEFLDAFDNENLEAVESLKVEKDALPEGMEVVLLRTKI